jgi:hypothetical protein
MQSRENGLNAFQRTLILTAFRPQASDKQFDYQIVDRSDSAVIDGKSKREDDVPCIGTGIVDAFQTIEARLWKPSEPAIKTISYESSIWNHIKCSSKPGSGRHFQSFAIYSQQNHRTK